MKAKRQIEDSEEVRRVLAELKAKTEGAPEEGESEAMAIADALAESMNDASEESEESFFAPERDTEESESEELPEKEAEKKDSEEATETGESDSVNEEKKISSKRKSDKDGKEKNREIRDKRENVTKKKKSKKTSENTIISLEHVTMSYVKGVPALNDINLSIKKGEFVFIVGESGSGKSTLIRLLLRELKPSEGKISVNGFRVDKLRRNQVPKLRRNMGVVFQNFRLLKDRNVYENVAFAQRIIQTPAREMKKNVPAMLSVVGLAGKYRAFPNELSGGEQQRVALARALVNRPPILLADEPTGNLDPRMTVEIMNLLEKINENGTTVLVVTHDDKIVNEMKKRVVTIKNGIIVSDEEKGGYIDED